MKFDIQRITLAIASAGLVTLYGCGGGTSSSPPATPGGAVATTADVAITVVDGPIKNATVCLDKNNNGACDAGEPTGKTDADGKVTLKVDLADVGKYTVVAVVGTDAIDKDTGAVVTPFTLKAPADKTGVVSPLTTLVHSLVESIGVTSAVAASQIQAQTGITVSLFEDFTKSTSADNTAAGTIARMLVVTTQQQSAGLGAALGTTALDGAVIRQADLDRLIRNKLLEILPALMTALSDPAVLAATTPAAKEAALLAAAKSLVADASTGLTTTSVATLVAVNNQNNSATPVVADAPAAGANLRFLSFINPSNWSSRVNVATLAQATPDAAGLTRSVQRRYSTTDGQTAAWTTIGNIPSRQSDLHFNGSTWVGCALNTPDVSSARDAKGNSTFNNCDNYEVGSSNRASFDVAGRTLLDVYNQINSAGYTNIKITDASTVLGATTTFPADSKLSFQMATVATNAVAYYPGTANVVVQVAKAVSDGGVASTPAGAACNGAAAETESTSLEGFIASKTGTPCIYGRGTFVYPSTGGSTYSSPDLNDEAWGNTSASIGSVGTAPVNTGVASGYYSGNTLFRVAFNGSGTNPVTYYACKQRFSNGFARNCTSIGSGSYTISSKGDARILTLNNPPAAVTSLGVQRVFVERGGKIYFGYQNAIGTFTSARLNLVATNALFAKLGLPTVEVGTPLTLTKTSYAGEYRLLDPSSPGAYDSLFITSNGTASTAYTEPSGVTEARKPVTLSFTNLAAGEFSGTNTNGVTFSGTINFLTGAIAISGNDPSSTPSAFSLSGARR